ncbi:hypothetical protein MOQ_007225 [Trypanosoma cruzi marinkellei]|uniref:RING-type domain-containing protein n=1 Tax=Trypanosoma cruzi marinkellei TaxID=85056 RepID=K2MPH4_TRYCR|nr:hypothetical protein MOQ_007225 [Trypanosoma cruzi marinkellei]
MMRAGATTLPASVSDEELDALIHEALTGVSAAQATGETRAIAAPTHPPKQQQQQQQRIQQNRVSLSKASPTVDVRIATGESAAHDPMVVAQRACSSSSSKSSETDSEAMLQAVLEGYGFPGPKGLETHHLRGKQPKTTPQEHEEIKKDEDDEQNEEETVLMEALLHLAQPPRELVSKNRRQSGDSKPHDSSRQIVTTQTTTTTLPASNSVVRRNNEHAVVSDTLNRNGEAPRCELSSEEVAQCAEHPPAIPRDGKQSSSTGPSPEVQDMEDEKQILTAILNAVRDRQSSVSGDLVYGEDDCNVDAVLQHAEQIAASSLRENKGQLNRILHLHEHIEMREELRRARGSVGWPSCVCARSNPVVIGGDPPKGSGASSLSLLPAAAAAKRPTLCVGTTLGVVLLFDANKKLCGMCGSVVAFSIEARGAVVSLSMSFDASTVLAGYERGDLVLWNTDTLTPLREIVGEFSTPATRLRYCCMDPFKIVVLNSSGSVKLLSFTRIMSKFIYRLTHIASSASEAPFNDMDIAFMKEEGLYLVAAVSADTLLVSALECGLTSVATPISRRSQPLNSARTHELLKFVPTSVGNRVLMCVAWSVDLEVFSVAAGGTFSEIERIAVVRLERPLHAMCRIADCCLLLLDQKDVLHLLDAGVGVIVETRVLHGVEPVVFSSRSCGMRCNAAFAFMGSDVFLLGRRRTFTCTLLSWKARLDALVEKRRFPEALELTKGFALEVALAVVGLHGDSATRRASIHSYLPHLITSYLEHVTETNSSQETLVRCVTSVIQFCSEVDAMDVFFGPVMEFLRRDSLQYSLALYCLEESIVMGLVTVLPDMYIQPFFDLFANETLPVITESMHGTGDAVSSSGMLRVERALMCLDGNHELLMRIAKKHKLVRLAVSILSYRQQRYVDALRFALEEDHEHGVAIVFFECSMEGYTISGDTEIPVDQCQKAKRELWCHLLTVPNDFLALLRMDPERVLSATFSSLQESGPDSPWGEALAKRQCVAELFLQLLGTELSSSDPLRPWELARREWPPYSVVHQLFTGVTHLVLTEALILPHMRQFCEHACSHFIYEFQIAKNEHERRSVQSDMAALMTDFITRGVDFSFAEDELRQQRMARALAALHCSRLEYDEAIDCYLDKENNCADPELSKDVFRVLREEMTRAYHLSDEKMAQRLREAVMHRISLLVNVDATSLAQFVLEHLQGSHEDVMNILRRSSGTFLRYLDELVAKEDPMVSNDMRLQNTYIELLCVHDPARVYPYLHSRDLVITYDIHLVLDAVKRHNIADAAVFLLEKTLMIDEAMEILLGAVTGKLRVLRQEVLDHVVSVCRKGTRPRLSLWTLTQQQDLGRTGRMTMAERRREGREEYGEIKGEQQPHGEQQPRAHIWAGEEPLQQVLKVGVDLCNKYNDDCALQSNENWFCLLELFTRPRRLLCDRQNQHNAALRSVQDAVDGFEDDEICATLTPGGSPRNDGRFPLLSGPLSATGVLFLEQMIAIYTKYVSFLLTHMVEVLDPSAVVCRIVEDHERERFGPFKPVIVDIMSSLNFELEVNRLCKSCIDNDIMALGNELHRSLNGGVVSLSDTCYICEGGLGDACGAEGETSVRIFACGHGYHDTCSMNFDGGAECAQCCKERTGENYRVALRVPRDGVSDEIKKPGRSTKENGEGLPQAMVREKEGEKMGEEEVSRVLRRLRYTRARLDGARDYSDLLCRFLCPNESLTPSHELLKGSTEKKLLAPAPPIPISFGDFSAETLDFGPTLTAGLTDEELLELFGTQGEGSDEDDGEDGAMSLGDGMEFQFDTTQ